MGTGAWAIFVVCGFIAIFSIAKLWNADNRGAMLWASGIIAVCWLLLQVSGCTLSPERAPWLEAGFAYDTQRTVGDNPACIVRLRQPVGFGPLEPDWLVVGYQHVSSCPMQSDLATVDQIELVAKIPLGRRQ